MPAPKGNRFWEHALDMGRPPAFETAAELRQACIAYFDWAEANPIRIQHKTVYQGKIKTYTELRPRAMLLIQLCRYIGVSDQAWRNWKKNRKDLVGVITWAESIIWEQKFQGAAVDMFNSNIIAQELGLKTKTEHTLGGETLEEFLDNLEEDEASEGQG